MASKRAYAEEDGSQEAKRKMPRLIESNAKDALEELGCVIETFCASALEVNHLDQHA
jgi:hypothetical protein